MSEIAFFGLGNMGRGMARRLLQAGHRLRVYNRTAARMTESGLRGARICATPREACEGAEAVIAMTAHDASSRAVWLGSNGALAAALAPGACAIECSTLSFDWVQELASACRQRGLRYLDAPVTGLPDSASAGTLTLLVGGDIASLDAARPWLEVLSQRILHFGGIGTGTAYKLIINQIGAVQLASLAEGIALAQRAGLDLETVFDAISTGQAASPQVVRNARRMIDGDHDKNIVFTPELRLKDVSYALQLAARLDGASPFAELAARQLEQLVAQGDAHVNESKIIEIAMRSSRPA